MKLILIGIQGAGKSTQGNLLSKTLGIPYLSTGHILRIISKEKTKMGRYIKEIQNSGALVPDKIMVPMVEEYLNRQEYEKGYIMDGFPRTKEQVQKFKNGIDRVIYLKVPDKEALWRLAGRNDDQVREDNTIQALKKRIDLFHKFTGPVIDFYRKKGVLFEVNGEKKIDVIFKSIIKELKQDLLISNKSLHKKDKNIVAIVGMAGAGKTEAADFFKKKGYEIIRFGSVIDDAIHDAGLIWSAENNILYRTKIRSEFGMAGVAIKILPKIKQAIYDKKKFVLDGLYSWEEYIFLKKEISNLTLLCIYASPKTRHQRLAVRKERKFSKEDAKKRDFNEIEKANKGGPIAIADYLIKNETSKEDLYLELEIFFASIL